MELCNEAFIYKQGVRELKLLLRSLLIYRSISYNEFADNSTVHTEDSRTDEKEMLNLNISDESNPEYNSDYTSLQAFYAVYITITLVWWYFSVLQRTEFLSFFFSFPLSLSFCLCLSLFLSLLGLGFW